MLLKLTPFQVLTVDWIIERVLYLRQPYENEVLDFLIVDSCSTTMAFLIRLLSARAHHQRKINSSVKG